MKGEERGRERERERESVKESERERREMHREIEQRTITTNNKTPKKSVNISKALGNEKHQKHIQTSPWQSPHQLQV